MKKSYNYILFDWDGCIVDSLPLWFQSWTETLNHYDIHISDKDIVEIAMHYCERIPGIEKINYTEFKEKLYALIHEKNDNILMCSNVEDTLKKLQKRGKKIAIVTSSSRDVVEKTIKNLNCFSYFDTIITRDDVTHTKPHKEPLEKGMTLLGARKDETLIIGDSDADIRAGKNAGITTVWFSPEENKKFYTKDHFQHLSPDYVIEDMTELLNIVQ